VPLPPTRTKNGKKASGAAGGGVIRNQLYYSRGVGPLVEGAKKKAGDQVFEGKKEEEGRREEVR